MNEENTSIKQSDEKNIITDEINTKEENKPNKLKRSIIIEYVLIVSSLILYFFFSYFLLNSNNTGSGIDGLGAALALVVIIRLFGYGIGLFALIMPIITYIRNKYTIKSYKGRKLLFTNIIIFLPILLFLLIVLQIPLSNLQYNLKYETGKNAYTVNKKNYKTTNDLYKELDSRGLIYNTDFDLKRMNSRFSKYDGSDCFYTEGRIYSIPSLVDYYIDDPKYNNRLTFTSSDTYPAYVYSAILYYDQETDQLEYKPIFKNENADYISGNTPYMDDYYIGVKFIYVDNDFYAIIGPSSSYNAKKSSDDLYNKPYTIILSEKDTITTYYKNKYYPSGGIENEGDRFIMTPNTNKPLVGDLFNIRKVDKLDKTTITKFAQELRTGVLKDSIDKYIKENENKVNEYAVNNETNIKDKKIYETIKDKTDTYTIRYNSIDHDILYLYSYQKEDINVLDENGNITTKVGYRYYLRILDGYTGTPDYLIGEGLTMEEASNSKNYKGVRPVYDESLIKVLKEKNSYLQYLAVLVPEYTSSLDGKAEFEVHPAIITSQSSAVNIYKTAFSNKGYTYISNPEYNLTKEIVEKNYGAYYVTDSSIIFLKENESCRMNNNQGKVNIYEITPSSMGSTANIYLKSIDANREGENFC